MPSCVDGGEWNQARAVIGGLLDDDSGEGERVANRLVLLRRTFTASESSSSSSDDADPDSESSSPIGYRIIPGFPKNRY